MLSHLPLSASTFRFLPMELLTQTRDGVLELCLNRPHRLNALTHDLVQQLLQQVQAAATNPDVRVVLLHGQGRAFCAGKDRDDPPTPAFVETLQALAAAIVHAPQIYVSAVQGWAVGAGLEIVLNTDLTLAARSARFALPEVQIGLFGTGGSAALLPLRVGMQKAKGMMLLGDPVSAEDAERWGLVWKLVDDDTLESEAWALASRLARMEPALLRENKRLLHREHLDDFDGALTRETDVQNRLGF